MPLWLLWLRKGHIGTLAAGLRAFDQWDKPAKRSLANWLFHLAWVPFLINFAVDVRKETKRQDAELEKEARESDSQPRSDDVGNNHSGESEKDAASDDETQGETPASRPAAGKKDKASGEEKD